MRFLCHSLAAAGALWAASHGLAADNPYGAPATLPPPSPRTQISPYWDDRSTGYQDDLDAPPAMDDPAPAPMADAAPGVYDEALSEGCHDQCDDCCEPRWYASIAGLYMTRDRGNKLFVTFDANNINDQLMHTQEADVDWEEGFEVTVGRRICCNHALELTYWTLDRLESHASLRRATDDLSTPIDVGFLEFGGVAAGAFFDNAREHRLSRQNEVHNVELNLLHLPVVCCNRLQVTTLAGVRFFKFDEDLTFASVQGGFEFGDDPAREVYLGVDVENNLVGFQIGARADYSVSQRIRVFAAPEVGIYNNHIENDVRLRTGNGIDGVTVAPADVFAFPRESDKDDFAMLAQLDLGLEVDLTCRWRAFGGYRAVAVSGVALSDEQIPRILADVPEWEDIDSNGHLILHGAFAGLEYSF